MRQKTLNYIKDSIRLLEDPEFAKERKAADEDDTQEHIQFIFECAAHYEMLHTLTISDFVTELTSFLGDKSFNKDVMNALFGGFGKEEDDYLYRMYGGIGFHVKTNLEADPDNIVLKCESHDMSIIFYYRKMNLIAGEKYLVNVLMSNGTYIHQGEKANPLMMKDLLDKMGDEKWLPFWEKLVTCWTGYSLNAVLRSKEEKDG